MTAIGWTMMIVSCGFVVGLLVFCVSHVLAVSSRDRREISTRDHERRWDR